MKEIAAQNNIDPKKLGELRSLLIDCHQASSDPWSPTARVLRFLATNHWFTEVAPDVFANNLLSSLLDTGKEITPNL